MGQPEDYKIDDEKTSYQSSSSSSTNFYYPSKDYIVIKITEC